MVDLLRDLANSLSGTIRAWNGFQRTEIGYFQSDSQPLNFSIAAVGKAFLKLEALLLTLQDLEEKLCSDNPQGVSSSISRRTSPIYSRDTIVDQNS
jgi:hypothetical protein